MSPRNADDPTIVTLCQDFDQSATGEQSEFARLVMALNEAQEAVVAATQQVENTSQRLTTPGNTSQRIFTVAQTEAMKQAEQADDKAQQNQERAQASYNGALAALENWLPKSMSAFFETGGAVVGENAGEGHPYVGLIKSGGTYTVVPGFSEAEIHTIVQRKAMSR